MSRTTNVETRATTPSSARTRRATIHVTSGVITNDAMLKITTATRNPDALILTPSRSAAAMSSAMAFAATARPMRRRKRTAAEDTQRLGRTEEQLRAEYDPGGLLG